MAKKHEKKLIDITPHKSLMLKVGQTGYSFQEAISELIDNSIDARIDKKNLEIDIRIAPESVQITDNGAGMDEQTAAKSIRLGFSSKKNQLGEFGLGLKTSCTFMGRNFTVITTPQNKTEEYLITYDEENWMKEGDWSQYPFTINHGVKANYSGTSIIIENLKVNITEKIIDGMKQELSIRFGPFIKDQKVKILLNNQELEPHIPKILGKKNKFKISKGKYTVSGWWGYQLRQLNIEYFGFNTFRRGRLVTTFDKVGLNPNQKVKQIVGEVDVIGVPITHDKKGWQKGTKDYKAVEKMLRQHFVNKEPQLKKILSGYHASTGLVEGRARKVNMFMGGNTEKEMNKIKRGDIIVTEMTRPQFLLAIRRAGAIVTDLGGTLCHAAIVSREFDIPAVVGTQNATKIIKDCQRIIVDGHEGIVYEN
ncbi:ATP-binding protein [Candidatus Kuenenbacteria bacterium]|nr:ATP-binding protein [Candidatus Kuenenbacteria bacterium]